LAEHLEYKEVQKSIRYRWLDLTRPKPF